jgi:hypothetical protein
MPEKVLIARHLTNNRIRTNKKVRDKYYHGAGGTTMMTEFELSIMGSSEYLLDVVALLGEHGVNIDTVATARVGDRWVIKFLSGSEEEVRRTFVKAGLDFKERKVLIADMPNTPGEWVRTARALIDREVAIDTSYLLGLKDDKLRFVFGVDNPELAQEIAKGLPGITVE